MAERKTNKHPEKVSACNYLLPNAGQAVNPLPEIDSFHDHQDAHLRSDLDHDPPLQKLLLRPIGPEHPGP